MTNERILLVSGLLLASGSALHGQASVQAVYDSAFYAWDAGEYPTALVQFQRVLQAPGGDGFLRDIALLTGERYVTEEVAADGTRPVWNADRTMLAFETPSGGGTATHLVRFEDGGVRTVASLSGTGAIFDPSGHGVAYLTLEVGPDLERAREEARQGIQTTTRADFARARRLVAQVDAMHTRVSVRDLTTDREHYVPTSGLGVLALTYGESGTLYALASSAEAQDRIEVYDVSAAGGPRRLTGGRGSKENLVALPGGTHLLYTVEEGSFGLLDLASGQEQIVVGEEPAHSTAGATVGFVRRAGNVNTVHLIRPGGSPVEVARTAFPIANPAVSPSGDRVVYQAMPRENWELMVAGRDSGPPRFLTSEIQHDLFPRFLNDSLVLAVIGEGRHRRSYLYDANSGARTRLFHNNTIRTVSPEYEWAASVDGARVAIVAERDGDTISPERGVYVVDVTHTLPGSAVMARLDTMLAAERDLRERGDAMFATIAPQVREVVAGISTTGIYGHARDLFAFGSKFITQPGNAAAIRYIEMALRGFGYEPELQWFEPRPGIPSANIIATLRGAVDPDLIYVVSSHFDSVERGPGADDNTSGTTALLEAARVLAGHPQAATVKFAFFTGEEAGLLGSREYVRRAVEAGDKIVGALNNDMIGFANDNRLDNTIRYSNSGIRDVQHAAAFTFTDLITYDAKYYKSTDAHAYYDAYGDIVGGIGSYPILGNPHYHQTHDVLETINHQLVAEVSKTTVATLMLLASSPSRLTGLTATRRGESVVIGWTQAVESDVDHYLVTWGPAGDPTLHSRNSMEPSIALSELESGTVVSVKAMNRGGMPSWDWARVVLP